MAFPEEKEAWEQEKKKKGGYDMELINKDALKKDILDLQDCYNGFSDTYDKACIIGVIDEQPTIEERKTGKWIDVACPNCGCKIHVEPEPEPQWIPCSERLPENRDMVLVTVKETLHGDAGCHVEEAYYCEEIWLDVNAIDIKGTSDDVDTFEIIAWMPLPEPYEEGAK